jgi:hypothetical protein
VIFQHVFIEENMLKCMRVSISASPMHEIQ